MNKNILIVGASGDIGIAIAKQLAAEGYTLLLHYYKNRRPIDELFKSVPTDQIIAVIQADLTLPNEVKAFVAKVVFPVDSIVFVSGIATNGLFQDATEETMDSMLTLHVKAPWMITKHLLPPMIQRGYGKILFITSIWGTVGASNEVIYSSVKGAQNSFVKALAKEVAPCGITVNGISPGFIDTKMNDHLSEAEKEKIISEIPASRPGSSEDIANMVQFLLSENATYVQGEVINVTGGW
ncbi:elongation factor P 5-aminopentanone reductase [Virgibacillus sp. W0430]|uniref:elongation factor P 5-aminopentanone reductase n=1 Tax=Virgibacillus sp. W0430 TaxID=3391580 RepID=UPI003F45ED3D